MVGKGSVNHNSRKFKAENVDGERSHFNIDYCNENIKKVYHKLFDEATPHLHIDFVPFTTGSKRGLDTRVSLKQALAK